MSNIVSINYQAWERREIYEMFKGTTMYTTVQLDITDFLDKVKQHNLRFYPVMVYCISKVINAFEEYKYGYDEDKNIGIWDMGYPSSYVYCPT